MSTDPFLGQWELQPDQNHYELGTPPAQGTYIFESQGAGYLVTMKWTTVEGKSMEMTYSGIPDGLWYPVENNPGVDTMSMTRVDAQTLDSEARKGEVSVAHGRRVLSEDAQTMTIVQSGKTPDGQPFANTSVYRRVG